MTFQPDAYADTTFDETSLASYSDWSSPASATTQAPAATTVTIASVLPKITTQASVGGTPIGTVASTLPKLVQAAQVTVAGLTVSEWSAPASAATQAAPAITVTVVSVLPMVSVSMLGQVAPPPGQETEWSAPASATTQAGIITGAVAVVLPKLVQSATAVHTSGAAATVASSLPKLVQAAQAAVGTTEYTAWASVQITVTSAPAGSIASTLPKLTQAATALAFTIPVGTVSSQLRPVTQAAVTTVGAVTPVSGTITQTLPWVTTSALATFGPAVPATGPIVQVLPALQQDATVLVDTVLPPPPTPVGAQGLVHIFQKAADTRLLPATNSPLQVVGAFQDRASMVGGYQSATGTISEEEFNAHPEVYTVGATWRVKSVLLEEAGLNPFIFAGELKEPQIAGGVVTLAADGWGLLQDRSVERFLVASMAMDQWAPGDEDPFNFSGAARILAEVRGKRMVFETKPHTSFKRNDAGQPGVWRSVPLVFWAPKVDLRWIKFTIKATGRNMNPYDLELVGTPTGPSGNLTVLRTWNLNNQNTDATFAFQIPAGYDLVGLRMIRSTEAKRPPHVRVAITEILIGSIATKEPFTLTEAYTALFGKMSVSSMAITADPQDVLPYDAARVPLSDIADDLAVFGQWYWRIWANSAGSKQGEAGPIGATTWQVQLVHTPVRVLPQPRYNVVQFDYQYGGGYTSQDKVRANPDPYPGTDVVYVLNIPEPPVFPLAQRLAQQIANMVSKPWYSGSGTLFKVNPGDRPAAVVKPGDKLVLQNYGSVEVIVNELSHSEDGALVEASFAESSMIVDRWLALWQQKINQGLSPNGAALAFLDAADPKPPTISAGFSVSQKREGRIDYDLQANATTVNEDIEDNGTYVSRYGFRARPIWPPGHASAGQPVPRGQGGGWRERTVRAPRDDEVEETKEATWEKILHPKKWAWEVQGWAVDALGQKSSRVTVFPGKPAAFVPVTPQSVSLDVDQRVMTVTHVIPPDPDDPTEEDQSYHHADIRINDTNGGWANPLRQDRKVKGESKRFRFHKPIQGTYYAQVIYVDFWGNRSTPVVVSNSKKIPPLPSIGSPNFDANGSRHARYRLRVPVTVNDAGHDDEVKRIIVQLTHKPNNVTPDANDRKVRDQVRINDDPQEALFRNLPKTHFVFVRAMSVDSDQKESGWTAWIAMGRPKDSGANTIPPQPTSTGLPAGQVKVTTPTPRRVVADWDEPDDDEATRWRVVFKRGATTVDIVRTRNTRAVYRVPKADVGQNHTAEVYAINDTGGESTAASGSGTPDDDPGGAIATNPPNQPAAPTLAFDAQGTRHAKFRAVVTAGTSTTDATHDAAHRYVIQLAHSTTGGANPPAGTRRQHGNVEGDATGDDLNEVFRNIPKNHFVWVRERARNAAGASGWTAWVGDVKPSGAVTPPVPGTVTATAPTPRRVKAVWPDPNDDETVRWRIEVKRGTTIVENGATRSNRYIYHVPTADTNNAHTVLVYAVSDTATESAASTSNAVTPSDDPTGGVGNPPNVPSNPSFTADGRGTKHAKYRIIVTAGTSATDASHDAAHRYVIQLAHDATDTGLNPPVGSKRQHGSVEGDATGDDLQEVFRNIPRRHHVWVRERARNAAGASDWTGWRTSSRPMDFGVAVAPNAPTGVTVTTPAPRRVKVTWNDPDDDESVRWRVEIRRSGATVETGFTRTTRYTYHVPKAFTGVAHNARVFAISETGTDSSQVDSLDGFPEAEPEAGFEAGDLKPRTKAAIPPNWLNCNGNGYSPSTWPNLFTAIGATYGGTVSAPLLPDLRGRKNVGVSSLVPLGANENQAEAARIEDHAHPTTVDAGFPGDDSAPGSVPSDSTNQNVSHHHQLAVGGSNTDTFTHSQLSARQGNLSGNILATPAGHAHQLQGQTNDTPEQHWHLHAHSINHTHGHGHNAGHGHGGGTGNKKGNFLGHHWLVYAA